MARRDPRGGKAKKAKRWRVAAYSLYDGRLRVGWGSDFQPDDRLAVATQALVKPHKPGSKVWAQAWWFGLVLDCRRRIRWLKPRTHFLLNWNGELALYCIESVDA